MNGAEVQPREDAILRSGCGGMQEIDAIHVSRVVPMSFDGIVAQVQKSAPHVHVRVLFCI